MATEVDRLVVVFDANFARMEAKLNKAIGQNRQAAKKIEDAWGSTGNVFTDLGTIIGTATGKIPGVSAGLAGMVGPAAAATAALGALTLAFHATAEAMQWADDLAADAAKIGITAEALQELQYAAEATDVSAEDLGSSLEGLNRSIGAVRSGVGDKKFIEAFDALKIGPEELKGIHDATDLLPLLADRLAEVGTVAERVQIAKKLGVEALLPLLSQGSAGISELTEKARALGLVIDESMVNQMADANEEMRVATTVIKANLTPAFAALATGVAHVSQAIVGLIQWFRDLAVKAPGFIASVQYAIDSLTVGSVAAQLKQAARAMDAAAAAGGNILPQRESRAPGTAGFAELAADEIAASQMRNARKGTPKAAKAARAGKAAKAAKDLTINGTDPEFLTVIDPNAPATANELVRYLREAVESANEIRKPLFDDEGLVTADKLFKPILDGLAEVADETHDTVYDGIRGGLEAGFRDGLPGVLNYLKDALTSSILDSVAAGLTSAVLGNGQQGGLLTSLASALFGRSYAAGTMSAKAGLALVGEQGPELVKVPGGSRIIPNSDLRNVGVGGAGAGPTTILFDNRGAVIWEQAARQMMSYADRVAAGSGAAAVQVGRRATPDDLARRAGRRLGR
jgi:hypothetical protein